jgi:hypothetical protein
MLLTKRDLAWRAKYRATNPKQGGNLHEQMKRFVTICTKLELWENAELWHALEDLEAEVAFHAPADPPFATRMPPRYLNNKENESCSMEPENNC